MNGRRDAELPVDSVRLGLCWVLDVGFIQQLLDPKKNLSHPYNSRHRWQTTQIPRRELIPVLPRQLRRNDGRKWMWRKQQQLVLNKVFISELCISRLRLTRIQIKLGITIRIQIESRSFIGLMCDWHITGHSGDDLPSQALHWCRTPVSLLNQSVDWYWQNKTDQRTTQICTH